MDEHREQATGLAALQSKVNTLEEQLEQLRVQLASRGGASGLTMRHQLRCPGCGCRKIVHREQVLDRNHGDREPMALIQPSIWRSRVIGEFEVYICHDCGLTEWYVKDLAKGLEDFPSQFRIIEAPSGEGYR